MKNYSFCIGGQWQKGDKPLSVINPYTQNAEYETSWASAAQVEEAISQCAAAANVTATLPSYRKYEVLRNLAALIRVHQEELAEIIRVEAGKPIQYARAEVARAEMTVGLSADYARAYEDTLLRLDIAPGQEQRMGLVKRVPVGPVLCFSPFNFPLNLVAHKIAPAMLAGCPFLLKPAPRTPITALRFAELILQAGYPPEAVHVLPFDNALAAQAVADPRFAMLSFTGSAAVGWQLKQQANKKKVVLELGGDAAAIIANDANLTLAAKHCAQAAFAYAGQVCISIQRIIIETSVYQTFKDLFLAEVQQLAVGDTALQATVVGPVIDAGNYNRVLNWVDDARKSGAIITGGKTDAAHNIIHPVIIENMPRTTLIANNEAFAPIVELISVPNLDAAWAAANNSAFGLQAAIYTQNETTIKTAFANLHVGGIIVNNPPSLRIDSMPYGGIKESGFGREGVRYAYEEMTEPRLLVW